MTPQSEQRIRAAVAVLGDALIAAMAESETHDAPERLYSVTEAAALTGLGRSSLYQALGSGRIRSIVVGRRRLVPSGAIAELAAGPPETA